MDLVLYSWFCTLFSMHSFTLLVIKCVGLKWIRTQHFPSNYSSSGHLLFPLVPCVKNTVV